MGAGACHIIILEGNLTYGVVETFGDLHPEINVHHLGAAVQSSCSAILHASLYFTIEEEYNKITKEYTQPIIDLHERITKELKAGIPDVKARELVKELTRLLVAATRKTYELFN